MVSRAKQFLRELKRRKVYRVAVIYVVVGWGVITGAQFLFQETLNLPETAWQFVAGLVLLGFPIALVLAWAYEVRPEKPSHSEEGTPAKGGKHRPESRNSIVVLPFDNMSPDPGDAYFCEGLTEEIITHLSLLQSLRVISRHSASVVKESGKSTREIAEELGVEFVLEGSVRKAGERLRITAQLIAAKSDEHLWAEKYDGVFDDIFGIQESVSGAIAEAMDIKLTPAQRGKMAEKPAEDPKVYACYLKARHETYSIARDSMEKGIRTLQHGLELWPDSPLLTAALGEAYYVQFDAGTVLDEKVLDQAEMLARRALSLQPNLPQGLKLLALLERGRGSLLDGTHHILAAYRADPTDSGIMLSAATFLGSYMGRTDLAAPLMNRVLAVDPLNGFNWLAAGLFQFTKENPEISLQRILRCQELSPDIPHTPFWVGHVLGGSGEAEKAVATLDEGIAAGMPAPIGKLALFLRECLVGDAEAADSALDEATVKYAWSDPDFSYLMAGYFSTIHRADEAFKWLWHAVDRSFLNLPYLETTGPYLDDLRQDPRFQELLTEVRMRSEGLTFDLKL